MKEGKIPMKLIELVKLTLKKAENFDINPGVRQADAFSTTPFQHRTRQCREQSILQ